MTITYGDVRKSTLRLIDEFSSRGSIQAPIKVVDYGYKIQQITNESIMELASTTAKLPKTLLIPHSPIKNTLADDTSSIKQHIPNTDYSIVLQNAKSCFFEATYPGEIVIEQSTDGVTYTEIETINVPAGTESFAEYRRLIAPTLPTNTIRLRFTGNYIYLFRNYVLYDVSFPTVAEVPSHSPWRKVPTPADFLDFNYAEIRRDARQFVPYLNMIKTPENELFFSSYEPACEILCHYWRKPTLLTFTDVQATDDALVIDLRDDAALIIAYNCAGTIQNSEEANRGDGNLKKYMEKRMNLISSTNSHTTSPINLFNW